MTANYARRRVGRRLTRSSSSKSKEGQDCHDLPHSKSPSKSPDASRLASQEDIPVPASSESEGEQSNLPSHSSSVSTSSSSLSSASDAAYSAGLPQAFETPLLLKGPASELQQTVMSPTGNPSFASVYSPSRSTFSASVSSKRKASNNDIDPSNLRRSVRQRAEASPFRLDSTEAQRDSTLFISQPQTPTKFKNMGISSTNRKDSLFMSLPASFHNGHDNNINEAQYAPFLDPSILSANSNASCFLPMPEQFGQQNTTTPAQEPPFTASYTNLSPAFDLMQYNDLIAPFPMTPQPAFLNFPQTPKFSGTFTIAPQAVLGIPTSSASSNFTSPSYPVSDGTGSQQLQHEQHSNLPQTPLSLPKRNLPRRARASSISSDTGSIIIKELDDEDENDEDEAEGDETAHPGEGGDGQENVENETEIEDERFALFASQVRRKAEAMSLKSSQGAAVAGRDSPSKNSIPNNVTGGALPASSISDMFEMPNKNENYVMADLQPAATHASAPPPSNQTNRTEDQPQSFPLPPMPTPLPPLPEVAPQYRIENGLYKDQYSSFPLSEDFDMGVSPTKSEKGRRGHHNKDRGGKPPRPPNCFILYRSDKVEEIRARQQLSKEKMQKDISKLVAELWKQEPQSVKDEYSRRADIAREEHLIKYPGYVYQPARKDKPLYEDVSPLKRSGSARPRSLANDLSKSAPAARIVHRYPMKEEDDDFTNDGQEGRSESPSPSKVSRSRTPLRQSRIPVPKSASKIGSTYHRRVDEQSHVSRSTIPISNQAPQFASKRPDTIAQNAEIFATQRGVAQNKIATASVPASIPMSKSRSSPSKMHLTGGSSGSQSPSAPRYAQPTAASMSKSMSQPLSGTEHVARSTPSHPQHQYAAYALIEHPLPTSPRAKGNVSSAFENLMNSTPIKGQQNVYPNISPPDVSIIAPLDTEFSKSSTARHNMVKVSGNRPVHQRSHTWQPALNSGPASTPSRVPSIRRSKTTPEQANLANDATSLTIPDGFVIGGKLYPAENVEEAMKAYKAANVTNQRPVTRMASKHSTDSNGPIQEVTMPGVPYYGQYTQQQQQSHIPYPSQTAQNYVIGIAPDGQQIPLIISQPQSVPSYTSWQNVPAFMPSSTQATPSTGYTYDFSQPLDPQQSCGFSTLYTPNTANSNVSNNPSSTALWFPQQDAGNQGAEFSQYVISSESFNNGTSPTFLLNDGNGHQQEYVLGGPSVEITNATGFAQLQDPALWSTA